MVVWCLLKNYLFTSYFDYIFIVWLVLHLYNEEIFVIYRSGVKKSARINLKTLYLFSFRLHFTFLKNG